MQIKNRLFSYPVYSSSVDDYKINEFTFDYSIESDGNTLYIDYFTKITNKYILSQLLQDTLKLSLLVECAKTAYRQLFVLDDINGKIEIQSSKLSARVDMCCLLLANKDFVIDHNSGISQDYSDASFSIKKGFIVGYDNSYPFMVDKDKEEAFKASSIISVVKKIDLKDYMDVDLDNESKIRIQLSDEMYQQFVQLQGQEQLPIVHSMIVLPALVYVVDQIKSEYNRGTYEDKYWYRCISKQLDILKIGIGSDLFNAKSSLVIAQELLKFPVNNALYNLTKNEEGE